MKNGIAASMVRWFAVIVCLAAMGVSDHLARKHFAAPVPVKEESKEPSWADQICTAFATSSCDEVLKSPWGELTVPLTGGKAKVPTAQLGFMFFAAMGVWLALVGRVDARRWWMHAMVVLWAGVGVGFCGYLAYVMYATLPQWCPLCAFTHVSSLVVFVCLVLLWPREAAASAEPVVAFGDPPPARTEVGYASATAWKEDLPGKWGGGWPSYRWVAMVKLTALLLIAAQHFWLLSVARANRLKLADNTTKYWQEQFFEYDNRWEHNYTAWQIADPVPLKLEGEPVRGPANAKHTIVVFSDFQCPGCAGFEEMLRGKILPLCEERYGGARVIFKHYPICEECNPHAGRNLHPQACLAARAAEAGRILGGNDGFWKMHDALFARRPAMKNQGFDWFVAVGKEQGFDEQAFREAMASDAAEARIKANIDEAANLGRGYLPESALAKAKVQGTPAIYIDHRPLRNARNLRTWQQVFRTEPVGLPPPKPAAREPAAPAHTPTDAVPQ